MAIKKLKKSVSIKTKSNFFAVGIGASAGGLDAYKELLSYLPVDTGMAFIFIQHLSPKHKSFLPEILGRMTEIPVIKVKNGTILKSNHIYVMPPNVTMLLKKGVFALKKRNNETIHQPINRFFESLSEDQAEKAISIILSGTGSDGAEGSKIIKANGGISFAQSPETAKYDSMPSNAIVLDDIDFILSPKEIAIELASLAQLPMDKSYHSYQPFHSSNMSELTKIMLLLKQNMGTDFTEYKPTTIKRRIIRRMMLKKIEKMDNYFKLLQNDFQERALLSEDVLINVTTFFREPESYEYLKNHLLKKIIAQKGLHDSIRIWVAGCSTGEEAYSIAICVQEALEDQKISIPVQIFSTDLSEKCIEKARIGKYLDSISDQVSQERLSKYFVKIETGYRISKVIRDICIFARHDLSRDPAYSKLDLISCRNLLIYLGHELQSKVMQNFHYSLNPDGFLFLGSSESVGKEIGLFSIIENKFKVYSKKSITSRNHHIHTIRDYQVQSTPMQKTKKEVSLPTSFELQVETDRAILARYSPPSVVINLKSEILQFRGNTEPFLIHKHGEASLNIFKMVREGLAADLKKAIKSAKDKDSGVRINRIAISSDKIINIEVIPLKFLPGERCFLIVFEQVNNLNTTILSKIKDSKNSKNPASKNEDKVISQIKSELISAKENLQSVVQDFEKANQELQSANEEVLSSNEELQSTNEELETSKEELQSTNEELSTVNDELQERNQELFQLNNDLTNVLNSVHIPIVIVGNDLSIRRFTTSASKIFNFIPSDVGRPLSHITSKVINMPDLEAMIKNVLEHAVIEEKDVQKANGSWYNLRIRPYKTQENKIEGAVVTLQGIEMQKLMELSKAIIDIIRLPILILDKDLCILNANASFLSKFKVKSSQIEKVMLKQLPKPFSGLKFKAFVNELLDTKEASISKVIELDFLKVGKMKMNLSATKVSKDKLTPPRILIVFEHIQG